MQRKRPRPTFDAWSGVVYRATSYDVPLWVNPNRRSGRWNIAGQGCTQYFALDAEAPWAELVRYENLTTEPEAAHYVSSLWQLKIDTGAAVDYSSFDRAEAVGFPADALVDDDYERCQAEAQWLLNVGASAILSPSAALPGSTNLTLFGARVPVPWTTNAALASALPAQRLSTGHPPQGLTARVRYFGQRHTSLDAYLATRREVE
jgi:RES domain-containing protein